MNTSIAYKKGDVIFKQGDYALTMFAILSGSVGIYSGYGTEKEKEITILGKGQFLGEMGLIEAYPRSATAVAMEDGTELQEIGDKEFQEYFADQPERLLLIMRQLCQRLRQRTEDYENARKTLDEMEQTKGTPGKRSKSLLQRISDFLSMYDDIAAEDFYMAHDMDAGSFYPYYYF